MKIQVLGTGCAKCKKLESMVREVIAEKGIAADVEKITDIKEIIKTGVVMTPGLIVDDQVKVTGKLPSKEELADMIGSV